MPISDLCSKNLFTIEKGQTLQQAAQLMKKNHVGSLVVVESNGSSKPIGILTDRDIVLNAVTANLSLSRRVEETMSSDILKISKSAGIAEAIDKMEDRGVRRIILVDESGMACGLISSDDILKLLARELGGLGRLVEFQVENERAYMAHPLHP